MNEEMLSHAEKISPLENEIDTFAFNWLQDRDSRERYELKVFIQKLAYKIIKSIVPEELDDVSDRKVKDAWNSCRQELLDNARRFGIEKTNLI